MRTTLAGELAVLRQWSDSDVHAELVESQRHAWRPMTLAWLAGDDWAARTAALLQRIWRSYVAPDWTRRRSLLERDVQYRAGLLAAHGWPPVLSRLGRGTGWEGPDAIRFSDRPGPDRVVGADGMLFVPVGLSRGSWLCETPPAPYALVYPARAVAVAPAAVEPQALDRLVGPGRGAILRELERPATSTELAAGLAVSLGTVGRHLSVLREAGLVSGTRIGRRVVYRRTDAGDTVLAAPYAAS